MKKVLNVFIFVKKIIFITKIRILLNLFINKLFLSALNIINDFVKIQII